MEPHSNVLLSRRVLLKMMQAQQMMMIILLLMATALPVVLAQQGGGDGDNSLFNSNAPIPGPDDPVLAGYDLVEYHNLAANQDGVLGQASIAHRHSNGYLYYFATEANRERFVQNPELYLPKYGGFCAWGLAWEYADEGWPWAANHMGPPCGPSDGWAILPSSSVDGQPRLYCSIYRRYQDNFNARQEEGIRLADARWIAFYGSLTAGPQNNGCYAWNWQECFARSIHTSVDTTINNNTTTTTDTSTTTPTLAPEDSTTVVEDDPVTNSSTSTNIPIFNVSQVLGDEAIDATWSEPIQAMMGILTFQWTILDDPASTTTTTTTTARTAAAAETVVVTTTSNGESDETQGQQRSPQLVVQLSATNISSGQYIAFGVAEQLMQGRLVACFSLDDDMNVDDSSATYNVTSTCRTLRGNGMGTSSLNDNDELNLQVLWSTRNATHYTIRLAMRMLGLIPHDPRLVSMSRVVFCRGQVSGDGSPQPHANNIWNRQAVQGIEWLSVLRNGNTIATTVVNDGTTPSSTSINWLPEQDSWMPVIGSNGVMSVLQDRVQVAYQLFRHYSNEEEQQGSNNDVGDGMEATLVQEIVEIELQNVEHNTDGYGDSGEDNMDAYIGFAFAKDTMTGLVITCSIGAGIQGTSTCKQWHGEGTNLYPISSTTGNGGGGAGGWSVMGVAGNGTHANFTLAGRVVDVVHSGNAQQEQQQQQAFFLSSDSNLRAIISIGRSPSDTGNPLQHFPQDREAFQLNGLAAGAPLSIVLQEDDTSTTTPLNKENGSNGPSSFSFRSTNGLAIAILAVVMNCLWWSSGA